MIHLPLASLYTYPILMPASRQVFLAQDPCNPGVAKTTLQISNIGGGKLTFSVPDTTAALVSQASTGVAPGTITFQMQVGSTVTRQPGTNLYSGSATNSGAPLSVNLASLDAINIPNTILVYMNSRQTDQRGVIFPVPTSRTPKACRTSWWTKRATASTSPTPATIASKSSTARRSSSSTRSL